MLSGTHILITSKFEELLSRCPEGAAKIRLMQLLSKIKSHLCLPKCMQNNERLEMYVTEYLFMTVLVNAFAISTYNSQDPMRDLGKIYAIFNTIYNILPSVVSYFGRKTYDSKIMCFKKIFKSFFTNSVAYATFFPLIFKTLATQQTGISLELAIARCIPMGFGINLIAQTAAKTTSKILDKIIKVDEEEYGSYLLHQNPDSVKRQQAFVATYENHSVIFQDINFIYFILFTCMILLFSSLPENYDALSSWGISNPFAINNIAHPIIFVVSLIICKINQWLTGEAE